MKHILNNLSEEEKNSIREQHTGGMKVMTESFSKLLNSTLGDSKPLVSEQSKDEVVYSIQKSPTGKFKIFATNATYKTPTDASTVFGVGSMWKEYNTQQEAQNAINSIVGDNGGFSKGNRPEAIFSRDKEIEEEMDVSSDSDYYKERKEEVSIPFDDLAMLASLASRFCSDKDNFPDCRQVRRIISRHSLFM
jgi:hypothetical protein